MKKQRRFRWSDTRLLHWSLLAWVGLVYLWVMWGNWMQSDRVVYAQINPVLLDFPSLALFTVLLLFYALLFWAGLVGVIPRRQYWLYFLVEGVLVFLIGFAVHLINVTFSLYLALVLGAIVMLGRSRFILVVAGGYLALFLLCTFLGIWANTFIELLNPQHLERQLAFVGGNFPRALTYFLYRTDYLALLLFIVSFLALYLQQMRAHAQLTNAHMQLEEAHAQLQESSRQIAELTRQAERQHLARELHDTLAQSVAGLIIQLQVAYSYQAQEQHERALKSMQQTMASVRETLALARGAIDDLRATATCSEFLESVTDEIGRFTETAGVPCKITGLEQLAELPANCYEHVQRAIHEGLVNVTQHARASQVWVEVEQRENELIVRIRDNGVGFEADLASIPAGHYGLLGLWERARLLGGDFCVNSEPGQGTTLRFCVPLEKTKQREVSHV